MRIGEEARLSDRRVAAWFATQRAQARKEKAPRHKPEMQPVITISRQFSVGSMSIAQRLADSLGDGWDVWDKELIEAIASSAQVRSEMVEALEANALSWMDQMTRNLFNVPVLEAVTYRHHLALVLLALAQQGCKVIVGRGANFALPHALNVRLEAAREYRVRRTMAHESIGHDEALRQVERVEKDRHEFIANVFGRDAQDRSAYDMVIQVDRLGEEATAAAIVAAVRARFRLA
ncbi:MAG: cytidylate kinase-like family protein [Chthonomonadales bacterium]|nr:cytidylate kinase-like family protein [Chthonomonadales bacterium]